MTDARRPEVEGGASPKRFGRREFLVGLGVGVGATVTAGRTWELISASAAPTPGTTAADVLVVGAGIAGLSAARQIVASNRSCIVLEANDHVGGRMIRRPVGQGGWIDLGGQWVGPTQTAILDLAGALGISHFDSYVTGKNVSYYQGSPATYLGAWLDPAAMATLPGVTGEDVAAIIVLGKKFEELAGTVNTAKPWLTPGARSIDSMTLATWIEANAATPFAKFAFSRLAQSNGNAPGALSLLFAAWGGAVGPHAEEPEKWLFNGAAGQIPPLLAAALGERVVLNQPVYAIRQDNAGVQVSTPTATYAAKYVIVAMPPAIAGHIEYTPAMPAARSQLTQRFPMQSVIKSACIYPTAWWREEGFSGGAIGELATVQVADSSPSSGVPGILTSFTVGGDAIAAQSLTLAQRQAAVVGDLVRYFGPKAALPMQFVEANWPSDQWSGGAFCGFMGPGVLSTFGSAIREPVGRIYWAGTETATKWIGYFDGAVSSGQDAAASILGLL
jgi:monoamine oxidase